MTSTTLRRSATAISGLALAAVLGTPAYADSDNANANAAAAQAEHGQPAAADAAPAESNGSSAQAHEAKEAREAAPAAEQPAAAKPAEAKPAEAKPAKATKPAKADESNLTGGYQGKSPSTPDQDGVGMDRGLDNNDKTGPGTDGNNGCGNDDDREDDNNGWCGRKPKKVREVEAAPAVVAPRAVVAPIPVAPAAPVAPAPVAPAPVLRGETPTTVGGVRQTRSVTVTPAARIAPRATAVAPARVSAAPTLQDVTLPFTGSNERTLLFVGALAIAAGAVMTELGRQGRQTA